MPATRLRKYPRGFYADMRALAMNASLDDAVSGRLGFEFVVWELFSNKAECAREWYDEARAIGREDRDLRARIRACEVAPRETWD